MNDDSGSSIAEEVTLQDLPNAKTAFPFLLAIDSRTFDLPLVDLQEETGYKVDAIQYHVPTSMGEPILPTEEEIATAITNQKNLALSTIVHLAPDPGLGDPCADVRARSAAALVKTLQRFKPLTPHAFVLELLPPDPFRTAPPRSLTDVLGESGLRAWKGRIAENFERIVEESKVPFPNFSIETSTYPLDEIVDMLDRHLFSFCLDLGTMFQLQFNITEHIDRLMSRTKVFHLHGISTSGEPHASLEHFPYDHIVGFLGTLAYSHYVGSVCLEIRHLDALIRSLRIADKAYREMRGFNAG